jgi:hypothetical protein
MARTGPAMTRSKDRYQPRAASASQPKTFCQILVRSNFNGPAGAPVRSPANIVMTTRLVATSTSASLATSSSLLSRTSVVRLLMDFRSSAVASRGCAGG